MINDKMQKPQDGESQFIKRGFYKSLLINAFFLALLLALYLLNNRMGFLDALLKRF